MRNMRRRLPILFGEVAGLMTTDGDKNIAPLLLLLQQIHWSQLLTDGVGKCCCYGCKLCSSCCSYHTAIALCRSDHNRRSYSSSSRSSRLSMTFKTQNVAVTRKLSRCLHCDGRHWSSRWWSKQARFFPKQKNHSTSSWYKKLKLGTQKNFKWAKVDYAQTYFRRSRQETEKLRAWEFQRGSILQKRTSDDRDKRKPKAWNWRISKGGATTSILQKPTSDYRGKKKPLSFFCQ